MKRINHLKYIYSHKLSPLGVRFMLGIIPIFILFLSFNNYSLKNFGLALSIIYSFFALLWMFICIPAEKVDE